VRVNELNEATLGGAIWNRLKDIGSAGASLSLKDRMIQRQFVDDLVGRAYKSIAQGIQGGLIDPNPSAGLAQQAPAQDVPAQDAPAQQAPAQDAPAQQAPAQQAPAQQAPAQQAPAQQAPAQQAPAPAQLSPEQIRAQKQKIAAANAQKQMAPFSKINPSSNNQSPEQIRAQKQKIAAANAQKQMAPFSKINPSSNNQNNNPNIIRGYNESLLDEEQYPYTISSYLQAFLKQYMPNVNTTILKPICDQVQASYNTNNYKAALQKLASAGFSLYWAGGHVLNQTPISTQEPKTVGDALKQGVKQGLDTKSINSGSGISGEWKEAEKLLSTMGTKNKTRLFNLLKTDQLPKMSKRNKKILYDILKKEFEGTVATKKPITKKPPVTENKSYKIWGKK
jgi:hypothetical protein